MNAALPPGGLLALDWGGRKVGYATCDEQGLVVTPRGAFQRTRSRHQPWTLTATDLQQLKKLLITYEPGALILGSPRLPGGKSSEASQASEQLAQELHQTLNLPVFLVAETLTSWEARRKGASNQEEDAWAAALLLQDHLSTLGIRS